MAKFSAADVKRLREQTGAGMMDCKKALVESDGDFDKAVEFLRVKGLKGVAKREGRDGVQRARRRARRGRLRHPRRDQLRDRLRRQGREVPGARAAGPRPGREGQGRGRRVAPEERDRARQDGRARCSTRPTRPSARRSRSAASRASRPRSSPATCTARTPTCRRRSASCSPPTARRTSPATSRCTSPRCRRSTSAGTPSRRTSSRRERRIAEETAREEGKPEQALPRIVEGRVNGYFKENVLLEQKFAKDQSKTVAAVLKDAGVAAVGFARFRVGA